MSSRAQKPAGLAMFTVSLCVALLQAGAAATARRAPRARVSADVEAMELVRTAQTAAETIATDHGGSYASVTRKSIHRLEPTIPIAPNSTAWLKAASGTKNAYSVTATSPTHRWFSIRRRADGSIVRTCAPAGPRCKHGRW